MNKILVTGACGQLGSEITPALVEKYGKDAVIATDIRDTGLPGVHYQKLDVLDYEAIETVIKDHQITQIYHLAAILSARAEQNPAQSWDINMKSLLNVLDLGVKHNIEKIFWPSSIAVFGPNSPKSDTPQDTVMDPNTVYGISKLAGERWLDYYWQKFGLDVRSIRYPGIISYKTLPGGGTTDYAVDIYFKANEGVSYDCFLSENTPLPMMFIDDAVRGTIELMEAPKEKIKVRSSYNLSAMSFTPIEVYNEIKKHKPDFTISYTPDFRQKIADSWPGSIEDAPARADWGWKHQYGLKELTEVMLENAGK